ncbi:MAG TPA: nucleotidyltransferase domain-containing protein [Solirubrobacterales bacterium]|nr:nucleotidyltransferase domain-containing protein [Solirubrobacterales bacterium]
MDLSAPFSSIFPGVDSAVLTVLTGSTKPRTGREVARLADRSQAATQRVLSRFVDQGLVHMEEAGRARLYTLNRDHIAAVPIAELARLRLAFFQRLRDEEFEFWRIQPLHVSVFGSAARGDGDAESDIDIFLVRPIGIDEDDGKWRGQVETLADNVFRWTGNHAGIAEVSEGDLEHLRHDRPAIVESLRVDAVYIVGSPLRALLRRV